MFKISKTKILILLLVLLFGIFGFYKKANAGTYYIDAAQGDDAWTGKVANGDFLPSGCADDKNYGDCIDGPWKTTANIDLKATLSAGDNFLFKRGETWEGEFGLMIETSGSANSPITIGAYGTGNRPKFRYTGAKYYPFGVSQGHSYVILENFEIVRATNDSGYVWFVAGDRAIIRNSVLAFEAGFSPTANDAIKLTAGSDYSTIENNEIYGAPNQGIDSVAADCHTIRNNIIHDCQNAIVLKGGARDSLIEKNLAYNFKYGAIGLGGTTDPIWKDDAHEAINITARNNVIYYTGTSGGGGGIFLWGAHDCKVYNNTIYGNSIAVQTGGDPANPNDYSSNNIIRNNIIWRTGPSGIFVVDSGNDAGLVMSHNIYYQTTGSGQFKVLGAWKSFSQWMNEYDYDDETSRFISPQCKDPEDGDFSLLSASPAIDAGTDVGLISDFEGNPIIGAPDIGAYEYQGENDIILPNAPGGLSVR